MNHKFVLAINMGISVYLYLLAFCVPSGKQALEIIVRL